MLFTTSKVFQKSRTKVTKVDTMSVEICTARVPSASGALPLASPQTRAVTSLPDNGPAEIGTLGTRQLHSKTALPSSPA